MKKRLPIILITAGLIALAAFAFLKNAYVVPVLMYHSIDIDDRMTKLFVSPENFDRQMKFLHENHYNVVGLDKVISYLEKKERIPTKTVAITIDDGYYNNYQYAYPILKKYNIPATIFIIVGKIGEPGWLGWDEIEEMASSGLVTIGSHTVSHLWLPSLGTKDLKRELEESKNILELRLKRSIDFLCYPIGAFDERVERIARQSGYKAAVTTNAGRRWPSDDIYAIKRIKISHKAGNLLVFFLKVSGYVTWNKDRKYDREAWGIRESGK